MMKNPNDVDVLLCDAIVNTIFSNEQTHLSLGIHPDVGTAFGSFPRQIVTVPRSRSSFRQCGDSY